jgi:pSer/pThr/pTyr-binding forkhead associated (FHA) protein
MSEFKVEDRLGTRQVFIPRLLTIGRAQNNDLILNTVYASRRHAWVWQQGDQFIIEDLGSTHGTYVNGQRLTMPRFLRNKDIVIMGQTRLTFHDRRFASAGTTPRRGGVQPVTSHVLCAVCGTANHPQATICEGCGSGLASASQGGDRWANDDLRTSRPITPAEPVVARPFPTNTVPHRSGTDKSARILILLLGILVVSLLVIIGMLVAYVIA